MVAGVDGTIPESELPLEDTADTGLPDGKKGRKAIPKGFDTPQPPIGKKTYKQQQKKDKKNKGKKFEVDLDAYQHFVDLCTSDESKDFDISNFNMFKDKLTSNQIVQSRFPGWAGTSKINKAEYKERAGFNSDVKI